MSFIHDYFDKLLLAALFLLLVGVVIHSAHHAVDATFTSWAREQSGTLLGALLGLITGKALAKAAADKAQ